jgi:WS/DGAT/MGAT family acyltransferase
VTQAPIDEPIWARDVRGMLSRHPAVGLAVGVLRAGQTETVTFGHADVGAGKPIRDDTVFRIGSITKTMTALALMQLCEAGLVDLDAPADGYLHAYRLIPRGGRFRQPTLREMLTHTAGIPDARHLRDLVHVGDGPWDARPPILSVPYGEPLPTLAEHYRHGLEFVAEPGTAFAYSNPTFATLGQIVEDVSGLPLERYFHERIFAPLGMADTDLIRDARLAEHLAICYTVRRSGPVPVPDRDWIGAGGGNVYSTLSDLLRYADALLHGGANAHGRVLAPDSVERMFQRQYETLPDLPAMGLAFFLADVGGHRVASHDGILPGFNAHLALAPDDGVALVALTNGSAGAMRWLPREMDQLLRGLLRVAPTAAPTAMEHHAEVWPSICGRYVLPPSGDLRGKLMLGGGLEVFVRDDRPMLRVRMPVPALWRGFAPEPALARDPLAFQLDLSALEMGTVQLRFRRDVATGRRLLHTDLGGQPISFIERGGPRTTASPIERLGQEDLLMLSASRRWPQDIGALLVLECLVNVRGQLRLDTLRDHIASRLHRVPRLRQVIRTPRHGRGGPYWVDDPAFDPRRHVSELRLEPPVDEAELLRAVEELRAQRFERRHPLWHIWFVTGLPDGKVAMFVKLHHTIGDGMAAMTIISTLLDQEAAVAFAAPAPWTPESAPRPSALVADNLRRRLAGVAGVLRRLVRPLATYRSIRATWPAVRELLAEPPGDHTSLDRMVANGRRMAVVRASYRSVRRIARANGASVNDVLLAAVTAGLRRLLLARGEPADGVRVRTYVPVTLRRTFRGPQHGNLIAQMAVPLSLDETLPADRLQGIAAETRQRKARLRPPLGVLFRGRLATRLLLKAIVAQRVNLTTACVPGPRRPAYFAGARVLEVFPMLPLIGNEPIGIGAVSYADGFGLGITVDADAVPDIEALAAGVRDELQTLGIAVPDAAASKPLVVEAGTGRMTALVSPGGLAVTTSIERR